MVITLTVFMIWVTKSWKVESLKRILSHLKMRFFWPRGINFDPPPSRIGLKETLNPKSYIIIITGTCHYKTSHNFQLRKHCESKHKDKAFESTAVFSSEIRGYQRNQACINNTNATKNCDHIQNLVKKFNRIWHQFC